MSLPLLGDSPTGPLPGEGAELTHRGSAAPSTASSTTACPPPQCPLTSSGAKWWKMWASVSRTVGWPCSCHSELSFSTSRPSCVCGGDGTVRGRGQRKAPSSPAQTLAHHGVQLHTEHCPEAAQQPLCSRQVGPRWVLQGPVARYWVGAPELSQHCRIWGSDTPAPHPRHWEPCGGGAWARAPNGNRSPAQPPQGDALFATLCPSAAPPNKATTTAAVRGSHRSRGPRTVGGSQGPPPAHRAPGAGSPLSFPKTFQAAAQPPSQKDIAEDGCRS